MRMEHRCRNKAPAAILHVGDLIYPSGVASADDEQWQTKVFDMYQGPCLADIPIFPVLGNHDYKGDVGAWLEMSARQPRWRYPSRHYSIEFPSLVTFYALDTQYPFAIEAHGIPNFGAAQTPWQLAFGHHPLTSESEAGGGHRGLSVRSFLLKRLLCGRVDAYVSGHTHTCLLYTSDAADE